MLRKFEITSITYEHLKLAFQRDGFDGIFYLLSEKKRGWNNQSNQEMQCCKENFRLLCKL